MSRIAGIFSPDRERNRAGLEKLLQTWNQREGWKQDIVHTDSASLGFSGYQDTKLLSNLRLSVALDGSVFNFQELGAGKSELEVIANLYERDGFEGMLQKLNGDFGLAIYDSSIRVLWLARDRFGVKPLYFAENQFLNHQRYFAFASQPGSLLQLPGVSREVNRKFAALFAACHYRYFDNDSEASPYRDIQQLPAANWLRYEDGKITRGVYWHLKEQPDFTEHAEVLALEYQELLRDAVKLRLRSPLRQAFTLSGGMDSSSVLAMAVHVSGAKQHAFSSVYEDKTYDESSEIHSMLSATVENWHSVKIGQPDLFSLIPKMIQVHDEPVATATWLSHFLVCEEAKKAGFESLFGGLGGDELNAGEYEYFFYHFADLRQAKQEQQLRKEVDKWVEYHDHPIFKKSFEMMEKVLGRAIDPSVPGKCLPDRDRLTRYWKSLNPDYFKIESFQPIMDHPFRSYLKNRTFQDTYRETIPCCLRAEDRQTTAFNLQNVVPFFDHRLAEFMYRVPGNLKIRDGVTKILLRDAMKGILPEETRTRIKKTGWNAPAHQWFSGKGGEQLLDLIHSQSFKNRGIYNLKEVERVVQEHQEIVKGNQNRENHMMFLWQLVNLELWFADLER